MIRKIALILFIFSIAACKNEAKKEAKENIKKETEKVEKDNIQTEDKTEEEEKEELPILVGQQSRMDIDSSPYDSWFAPEYDSYKTDVETIAQLTALISDVKVVIFLGTWCEDSQREVPRFYKIIDDAKFSELYPGIITLNRDKETPEHLEDGFNITNVPTFIFYKNGKEINRIVESPVESLEKDMMKILSGKTYKHTYAE